MKYLLYPLFFVGILILQGCISYGPPINSLKKPSPSKEQTNILNIIQEQLPPNADILQVSTSNSTQKFHYQDLNNDNKEELIVFYNIEDNPSLIEMAILKQEGSIYNLHQRIKLPHKSIIKVEFNDLDKNGTKEILLHFSFMHKIAEQKSLFIYEGDTQGNYKLTDTKDYYDMGLISYNNADVFLFISRKENNTLVTLSTFEQKKIKDHSELTLPLHILEIRNTEYGNISKKEVGATIEFLTPNEQINTYMIQIEDYTLKQIKHPFLSESTHLGHSADFNYDSIIDIPVLHGDFIYGKDYSGIICKYNWNGKDDFELTDSSYINAVEGYSLSFPTTYHQTIAIKSTEKTLTAINKETKQELFTISKFTKKKLLQGITTDSELNEKKIHLYKEYEVLAEKKGIIYAVPKKAGFYEKGFRFSPHITFFN